MKEKPTIVANRMRELREGIKLSQAKLAALLENIEQPAIFRYESGQSFPPYGVLMQYADFFDISLDYLFGRTDNPQGKLYNFQPKVWKNQGQIQELIEMCFDPASPANAQLKETLLRIMEEQNK
ncbi:MAG: helix-turn-helix transcriptional regulator [Clostridiales bacterium]|nr:helix-turn-helix transcriptional regulator [Clostridiales bacterium]